MPTITLKMDPYNITGFSPLGMTGLDLWLDGNDSSTMYNASNGGANVSHDGLIYRWEDKSGNANHVYTIVGVGSLTQPQYYENLTNNKGGITFSNSVLTNLVQAPYPVDMYMVLSLCNYNNIGISGLTRSNMNVCCIKYPGGTFGSNKDFNSLAYGLVNGGQGINYSNKWVNNSCNYTRTPNTVPSTEETSMGFILLNWGISNSDYRIKRYTTNLAGTTTYTTWPNYAASNTAFRYFIGGIDFSTSDSNFTGSICEILSFSNQLNVSNRTLVESYLSSKWGLQRNIPVTHPGHLDNFPSYIKYSLSTIDGTRGYDKKGTANFVYVQAPDAPTFNLLLIANAGTTLTLSWFAPGAGGVPDYYSITVLSSTDNITFSAVKYISRYPTNSTSFIYTIGSIDNKYYNTQIVAQNSGGSSAPVSAFISILNSVPGNPTVNTPEKTASNTLYLSWAANEIGGVPITYNVNLYSSSDNFVSNSVLIYTENGTDELDTTIDGESTSPVITFTNALKYRSTVQAINGTGSSSIISSSIYTYPLDGV